MKSPKYGPSAWGGTPSKEDQQLAKDYIAACQCKTFLFPFGRSYTYHDYCIYWGEDLWAEGEVMGEVIAAPCYGPPEKLNGGPSMSQFILQALWHGLLLTCVIAPLIWLGCKL